MLYRVQTMPGLGWLLKRDLFEKDILPQWPHDRAFVDWDMWIRRREIMKNRDCIIPDISRTLHIGNKGINVNPFFQKSYFDNKSFSKFTNTKFAIDSITYEKYENLIIKLTNAKIETRDNICSILEDRESIINTKKLSDDFLLNKTRIICIQMENDGDYKAWLILSNV